MASKWVSIRDKILGWFYSVINIVKQDLLDILEVIWKEEQVIIFEKLKDIAIRAIKEAARAQNMTNNDRFILACRLVCEYGKDTIKELGFEVKERYINMLVQELFNYCKERNLI